MIFMTRHINIVKVYLLCGYNIYLASYTKIIIIIIVN